MSDLTRFLDWVSTRASTRHAPVLCAEIESSALAYLAARARDVGMRTTASPDEREASGRRRSAAHERYLDSLRIATRAAVAHGGEPLPVELHHLMGDPRDTVYRQHAAVVAVEWVWPRLEEGAHPRGAMLEEHAAVLVVGEALGRMGRGEQAEVETGALVEARMLLERG